MGDEIYEELLGDWKKFDDWCNGEVDRISVNHGCGEAINNEVTIFGRPEEDAVNHPSHYTKGRYEAIDVIEDAIEDAPYSKVGFLQGQALKYLLRLWNKQNPQQDAAKAQWYLNRLVEDLANH